MRVEIFGDTRNFNLISINYLCLHSLERYPLWSSITLEGLPFDLANGKYTRFGNITGLHILC